MSEQQKQRKDRAVAIFMAIVALTGLALGLSDSIISNYFYDAFGVDAFERGMIEFPREMPGVISVLIVSGFAFLGNIKLAIIAQALSIIGIFALGLIQPSFSIMLIFLFINSLGMHLFMPLYDSIGMSLANKGKFGTIMGKFNGFRTAFSLLAGVLVFFGFRFGFFSFQTPIIVPFIIAGILLTGVLILLIVMRKYTDDIKAEKTKFILKKSYFKYYLLAFLFGARKQIMYVYAPWVLIELLGFGADNMALLIITGSAIGIFFIPMVGKWIDKYGTANIMIIEACLFLVIYLGYGIVSAGLHGGWLLNVPIVVAAAVAVNIIDRMTIQFGMVRNVYMRSIAETPEDVTPTLATGMALDHIVSIVSAMFCGWLWFEFGPQYVFVFAAVLALGNIIVAMTIKRKKIN